MTVMFCVKLAGIPIEVTAAFDSTKEFCKEYLTDETPLFSVAVTQAHIEKMREQDRKTALAEGRPPADHSDRYLETLALADAVLEKLISHKILLFHGAVVAVNGMAYMFTAKSGTGKTTHCNLWLNHIPGCHILNGDKPFLLFKEDGIYACGTPWMGKENYGTNEILPLKAVCLLGRDKTNHITEISLKDSLDTLLNQCHIPAGSGNILSVMRLMQRFSGIKLYRLGCNMEKEAAFVSCEAMVKD